MKKIFCDLHMFDATQQIFIMDTETGSMEHITTTTLEELPEIISAVCFNKDLDEVLLTGNKLEGKKYYNHSRYAGGLRTRTAKEMVENYPVEMVERAVKGMLPHNRLGRQMYKKLFVYAGNEHPHMAQKPEVMEIK